MTLMQIVLWTLLLAATVLVGWFIFSWHHTNKNAPKFDVLGTVVGWQDAKIPLIGRAIVQYTKKGKPMQAQSSLMLRKSKLRVGIKCMWTVYAYRMASKPTVYIARKKR